ncbi:hypothetical protein SAMN05192559_10661 [Halobacillus karajensis]|uniref:Uncharacterized protein n=1 Tax=Halobacillus karajensis TaxID=195088 RepID=A0A059NXY0_9BACI|nr:hypothetical protein [Halobacillus karajensis]CDQ21156.1 hypothetical protein BN982_03521 [Halobacillus karajensis]CDQ24780.1 hypothetical protein BN983_03077 [Halobacillus karajensis]CDQ28860.1 hypothetical protein BN981_03177 [Halobacillus karajensis]SEH95540.1 hypothetical protein SAMN05192559_10661 [Halobacillus karajensis]
MNLICSHPVYERTRVIKNNQQHYLEHEEWLELYETQVIAPKETFPLHAIHDVSYKSFSSTYGLLYLHTLKGVRAYTVKEDPAPWMQALKKRIE